MEFIQRALYKKRKIYLTALLLPVVCEWNTLKWYVQQNIAFSWKILGFSLGLLFKKAHKDVFDKLVTKRAAKSRLFCAKINVVVLLHVACEFLLILVLKHVKSHLNTYKIILQHVNELFYIHNPRDEPHLILYQYHVEHNLKRTTHPEHLFSCRPRRGATEDAASITVAM